ncbi:MAG: TlpA disulfide reductase family protein [Dehalococcoidia bacterium]
MTRKSDRNGSPNVVSQRRLLDSVWIRNSLGLLVLTAIVGGLVAIDSFAGNSNDVGPLDDRSPKVGQPAPQFALRDANGDERRLDDYSGQVVWLNFWATWCIPCRQELPDIQRLADEYADAGLVVLTVNFEESEGAATDFWAELGLELPILFDSGGEVARQYHLRGFPDTFFIDRDGTLRAFKLGFLSEEQMRERLAELGLTSRAIRESSYWMFSSSISKMSVALAGISGGEPAAP